MAAVYDRCNDSGSEIDSERSDECELNLDFEVSDYEAGDEDTGIRPYQYEPEFSASDSDTPASDEDHDVDQNDQDRLHTLHWYKLFLAFCCFVDIYKFRQKWIMCKVFFFFFT